MTTERQTIEARTIRDLAELREFIDHAIAIAGRDPSKINLATPVDMRLTWQGLTDGSIVYDLVTARW